MHVSRARGMDTSQVQTRCMMKRSLGAIFFVRMCLLHLPGIKRCPLGMQCAAENWRRLPTMTWTRISRETMTLVRCIPRLPCKKPEACFSLNCVCCVRSLSAWSASWIPCRPQCLRRPGADISCRRFPAGSVATCGRSMPSVHAAEKSIPSFGMHSGL